MKCAICSAEVNSPDSPDGKLKGRYRLNKANGEVMLVCDNCSSQLTILNAASLYDTEAYEEAKEDFKHYLEDKGVEETYNTPLSDVLKRYDEKNEKIASDNNARVLLAEEELVEVVMDDKKKEKRKSVREPSPKPKQTAAKPAEPVEKIHYPFMSRIMWATGYVGMVVGLIMSIISNIDLTGPSISIMPMVVDICRVLAGSMGCLGIAYVIDMLTEALE